MSWRGGMGAEKDAYEPGDIPIEIHVADSLGCAAETNTAFVKLLASN